ncbi:hypothetical protein N431DRAFT_158667 [Stipitochalara longipes BDJ]|nr:hypothetical protein N431DRAFT_158667 [Stipitochalara longipes BDJ]
MALLIALIALVDGDLSRPFDLLPREWRTVLVKCTYAIDGMAGCQACHRSHLTLDSDTPRPERTYLTSWMALMGETALRQSAPRTPPILSSAIAMQLCVKRAKPTKPLLSCAPPAPFVRSRSRCLLWFSFEVECWSIYEPSLLGLLSSEVSESYFIWFRPREVSTDDGLTTRVQNEIIVKFGERLRGLLMS